VKLSFQQLEQLWVKAGGAARLAPTMAAIALAESGGNTTSLNDNPSTGDYSVGLWQINYYGSMLGPRTARYGSPIDLRNDPLANAKAAVDLAANGAGLENWSTYKSGAYKSDLSGSSSATTTLTPEQQYEQALANEHAPLQDWLSGVSTGWVKDLSTFATNTFGYALVYFALVMFAIVLAIFGLLGLLGVHPRTVMAGAARAAAVAA
jgi:hypothetical protein